MLFVYFKKSTFCFLILYSANCFAAISPKIQIDLLKQNSHFTTWQGIEPDKWATLWLIKRYVSPNAYFLLVPPNAPIPENTISFGTSHSPVRRANRESMFRRLKDATGLETKSLQYIDQLIFDAEVNIWDSPSHPHSIWFETLFRQLQARYKRDQVPIDCYLAFFDNLEQLSMQEKVSSVDYSNKLSLLSQCPGLRKNQNAYVRAMSHLEVLREISLGKKVIFVDTREDDEYDEVHLPGAKLLRLRDVDSETVKALTDADLVIPYCVKDFRGFEVAKSMKQLGISHVATLSPNGLKGWIKAGLPVTQKNGVTDAQARVALLNCSMEPMSCIKKVE